MPQHDMNKRKDGGINEMILNPKDAITKGRPVNKRQRGADEYLASNKGKMK